MCLHQGPGFGEHLRILPTTEKEREEEGETESLSKIILFSSLCLLSLLIIFLYFFPFSLNFSSNQKVPCIECYVVGKTELEN